MMSFAAAHAAPALRAHPAPSASVRASAVPSLVDALRSETRLLEELLAVMQRQRAAVADDDLEAVDNSVFATHRVLFTLGEARKRRRSLNRLICDDEELPLRELEDVLGDHTTDELLQARDALHRAASSLSQEVEVNRRVLRRALASGEEYVRALYGPGEARGAYGRDPGAREAASGGGILLNRTA